MIKNATEIKAAVSTYDIIKEFIDLKKRGANYLGLCPFHNEKTPSFTVFPNSDRYKCFGCGESGDGIQFLIEHKGMSYPEALEYVARVGRVSVQYQNDVNREEYLAQHRAEKEKKQELKDLMGKVINWYFHNTWGHVELLDGELIEVAGRLYSWEIIQKYQLCYAPAGNALRHVSVDQHWNPAELQEIGVLYNSEGRGVSDTYRDRSLFPIHDHLGNAVGIGGRKPSDDTNHKNPKYINTRETLIYDKTRTLYALALNRRAIREAGYAILVEGYTDVISLDQYGFGHAVATCGTALTTEQATLLKRYTEQVVVLRDGDEAGKAAAVKDVEILIQAGLAVQVAMLPIGHDPDSFIRQHTARGFDTFLEEEKQDALIWRVMMEWDADNLMRQEVALDLAGQLLAALESTTLRQNYIRELTKKNRMGAVKKLIDEKVSKYMEKAETSKLTDQQTRSIIEYGLYERNHCYYVSSNADSEGFSISNFIIKPLMLVIGAQASQRLVEIRNEYGKSHIINCDAAIFTSLSEFKKATERMGNFLFTGKPEFYDRVKSKVYRESRDCFPITVMGLHREGFYAWGNGISVQGLFREVDEFGIVEHDNTRYFLPAFSRLQENIKSDDVDEEFEFEKKFCYYSKPDCISITEWTQRMEDVHGWNGAMAVAFACASLFRDIIFQKFQFFPHLNMFGPSGSGKTFLARSVMAMFGRSNMHDPFNLASGTPVAFKRRLAQVSNGIIWFDEYSNDVDFRRVEALKGAYDGAGHERGIATNDNRTKTTKVKSALLLSGQQQPTKDIALFKRVISLNCKSGRNTLERQKRAKALKSLEESGQITQITQYLLQYRDQVSEKFAEKFETARALVNQKLEADGRVVEDRIVNNHLIPLIIIDILINEEVDIGFDFKEFFDGLYTNIIEQSEAIFSEDEISIFWRIIQYLHDKGMADPKTGIHHNADIRVEEKVSESFQDEMNPKEKKDSNLVHFKEKKTLVYIRFAKIHPEYQERHQRQRGKNGLDLGALQYYLRGSSAFLGRKRAKKFGIKAYSCYVFDMDELPIELPMTVEVEGEDAPI